MNLKLTPEQECDYLLLLLSLDNPSRQDMIEAHRQYGQLDRVEEIQEEIRAEGMRVMIDWVERFKKTYKV